MDLSRPFGVITSTLDGDVLAALARAETGFTGRQVHQLAGRGSEKGIRNALHRLVAQGIVTSRRIGSLDLYELNRDHLAASAIINIARQRGRLIYRLRGEFEWWRQEAVFAAMFGSAARREMTLESDIDIFIVRPDSVDADDPTWFGQIDDLTQRVRRWTGNPVGLLELDVSGVQRAVEAAERVLGDIVDHGVVLAGPWDYLVNLGVPWYRAGIRIPPRKVDGDDDEDPPP